MIKILKQIYLKTLHKIPLIGRAICFISVLFKGIDKLEMDKEKLNIICTGHIGEIYYICLLSKIISNKNNKYINLIISEKYSDFAELFNSKILSFSFSSDNTMKRLARLGDDSYFLLKKYRKAYDFIVDNTTEQKKELMKQGYNFIDLILLHYDIKIKQEMLLKPNFVDNCGEARIILEGLNLDYKKTIMIFPEAKSCKTFCHNDWINFANRCIQDGYSVCFNTKDDMYKEYPRVFLGILDTIKAIEYCGTFVAIRSGICDLVQELDVKKIAIYPKKMTYYGVAFYDIYNMKLAPKAVMQVEVESLDEVNLQ